MKKLKKYYELYLKPVNFFYVAALTYYSILALIPGLSILFHVLGWFNILPSTLHDFLLNIMPLESSKQIIDFVYYKQNSSIVYSSFIFIISLFIISSGILRFIKYLNQIFKINKHSSILLKIRAIIVSLFLILTLGILLILLMLILPVITNKLPVFIYYLVLYLCYFVIHFIMLYIIYKLCLYKDIRFKYIYKGIIFFSFTGSLLYLLFAPLVKIFANNYKSLGPLASISSLLIFLYIYFAILLISLNISLIEYKKMLNLFCT